MNESKRRVQVGRKPPEKAIDLDIQAYVDRQITGLEIEEMRGIILNQEIQLNTMRLILFDMASIVQGEHHRRDTPVTKKRIAHVINLLRRTFQQNLPELRSAHLEVHDGDASDIDDIAMGDAIEETVQAVMEGPEMSDRILSLTHRIMDAVRTESRDAGVQAVMVDDLALDDEPVYVADEEDILENAVAETEAQEIEEQTRRRRSVRTRTRRRRGAGTAEEQAEEAMRAAARRRLNRRRVE